MTVTLTDMIKCVRREIVMRRGVYPRRVTSGHMKQADADRETACMEAVLDLLEHMHVRENE